MPPTIYDLRTDYARFGLEKWQADAILTHRFIGRRQGAVVGSPRKIFLHIQDGWTVGSLDYWVGKQASSTVMIQRDGSILKIIGEQDGPWTNGDTCNPVVAEVSDLLSWGGNPNIWTLSIESEGKPWEPQTMAQLDAIEWQCREWMRLYPSIKITDVERHAFVNMCTRPNCPGMYYDAIIKRLGGNTTTPYVDPITYPWLTEAELAKGIDRMMGSVKALACRRLWEVKNRTGRFQKAGLKSPRVGPDLMPGDTFFSEFVFYNSAGGWLLTSFGTRIFMGDLTESVVFN